MGTVLSEPFFTVMELFIGSKFLLRASKIIAVSSQVRIVYSFPRYHLHPDFLD